MPIPITFLITDLHRGGSPLMLADLSAGLLRRGIFVPEVVSIAPPGEIAALIHAAGVLTCSLQAAHRYDWRILSRFIRHLKNLPQPPAIICSILIHANILATLSHPFFPAPTLWIHSMHTVQDYPRWHWPLQGILGSFADAAVAPSSAILKKWTRFGPVQNPQVIPNGIDIARFANASPIPIQDRPWPKTARVFGYIGRFDPVKRIDLLLRAAARLIHDSNSSAANLHVALIGYGPEEMNLKSLSHRLGIADRVHFPGPTSQPEKWLKTFDLFCSPSPAEGFGLTLIEAHTSGIPIVACATPAIQEVFSPALTSNTTLASPQIGWIPPQSGDLELAQVLKLSLLNNRPPIRLPNYYTSLSMETMVERYESWFLRLLNARDNNKS